VLGCCRRAGWRFCRPERLYRALALPAVRQKRPGGRGGRPRSRAGAGQRQRSSCVGRSPGRAYRLPTARLNLSWLLLSSTPRTPFSRNRRRRMSKASSVTTVKKARKRGSHAPADSAGPGGRGALRARMLALKRYRTRTDLAVFILLAAVLQRVTMSHQVWDSFSTRVWYGAAS